MAVRKIGAKRKTTKKTAPRRRRRVSGAGNNDIMAGVAVIAGAVGGRILSNVVAKQFPGTSLMVVAAGQLAVGYMLPKFVKNPMARNIGLGMMAIGGTQLVVSTGIISGAGNRMQYRINGGTSQIRTISGGTDRINTVSGVTGGDNRYFRQGFNLKLTS